MAAEKNFEKKIKNYLQSMGVYALGTPMQKMEVPPVGYYEKRWGSKMTKKGLPDLHIVINGNSLEFEVKGPDGKASELQKRTIEQIINSGCRGAVLYEHVKDIPNDNFPYYTNYTVFKEVVRYYAVQS